MRWQLTCYPTSTSTFAHKDPSFDDQYFSITQSIAFAEAVKSTDAWLTHAELFEKFGSEDRLGVFGWWGLYLGVRFDLIPPSPIEFCCTWIVGSANLGYPARVCQHRGASGEAAQG